MQTVGKQMKAHIRPRIAIDGRPALWPRTGIGTITDNVLKNIGAVDPDSEYFAYFDADPGPLIKEYNSITGSFGGSRNKLAWANGYVPRHLKLDGVDVFVTFLDKEVPFFPSRCKIVSTVHDLIPLRFPETVFRNLAHRLYYNALLRASVRRSDAILTDSEYSKGELITELGVNERKIHKMTLGVNQLLPSRPDKAADVLKRYGLRRPYVLALGSTEPRKNNSRVIEAMRLLHPAHPDLQLAIAGRNWRGREFQPEILNDHTRLIGFVADADMPAIIGSAEMLVFASIYEGFGLPVIEGMVQGVPVVASRVTSIPEVGGDAALYVDPCSVSDIAEKIERVLLDPELAAAMRCKGIEQAKNFQWTTTCTEIASLCAGLLEGSR
jgi:glycosyltransferase involved in cell wall biosynthesis